MHVLHLHLSVHASEHLTSRLEGTNELKLIVKLAPAFENGSLRFFRIVKSSRIHSKLLLSDSREIIVLDCTKLNVMQLIEIPVM